MVENAKISSQSSSILRNSEILEDIIDYQEYFLLNDNCINKLIVGKNEKEIFIKNKSYLICFNHIELSLFIKEEINSLNEAFYYIVNLFEDNKVAIVKIIKNEKIKLKIIINNERNIDLELIYNKHSNDIYDPIYEIRKIKEEINKLKKNDEIINPKEFKLVSNTVDDSFAHTDLDNSFTVFKAINDILYLVYSNDKNSIISYDLKEQKKVIELKNIHNYFITNFNHYLDKIKKRDLIISVSRDDNNLKIWNANNWECIKNMTNINKIGLLLSACFLENKNKFILLQVIIIKMVIQNILKYLI